MKALRSSISSFFQKQLSEDDLSAVVSVTLDSGALVLANEKITYALDD